jgi:glycosyltransferase involved in cell wall biosynthesis
MSARLLFVSGLQLFPPLSGGNLRSQALASALRRRGIEVFVYSLVGRKADYLSRTGSGLQAWPDGTPEHVDRGWAGFLAQWGSYALSLPPLWITAYLAAGAASPRRWLLPRGLRRALDWCDTVVADFPFLYPVLSAAARLGKRRVLSTHNLEHRLVDGDGGRGRWLRAALRALEVRAARCCDVVVSCCGEDARFFQGQAPAAQGVLVPNGVDPRRFEGAAAHRRRLREALWIAPEVKVLLFSGSKWGPNRAAFERLVGFAREHAALLAEQRLHLLVVGSVAGEPVRLPGLTATGRVERAEPYFAAADAAINPVDSGGGTNVKMGEFIVAGLPVLTTPFGARGLRFRDGETGLVFDPPRLGEALCRLRRLFDEEPGRLRAMAAAAYARNQDRIDMDACVAPRVDAVRGGRGAGAA